MNAAELEAKLKASASEVHALSQKETHDSERTWQSKVAPLEWDPKGRIRNRWVHKNALEYYRQEAPGEFICTLIGGRDHGFRCHGGKLPEFGFDGVRVWSTDLSWTMMFMTCDLEGGPYFVRREWQNTPA